MESQRMFFVATAPREGGHVNCSPKGLDSFRVLDETRVAYLDFVGSGVETIAHVRENGRICVMFCAFEGPPKILRLQGGGRAVEPGDAGYPELLARFEPLPRAALRAILVVDVERVAESCGFGVPLYQFEGERDQMGAWCERKGAKGVLDYQRDKNATSLDGLPALRWPATDA
jgi:hypothetical protein